MWMAELRFAFVQAGLVAMIEVHAGAVMFNDAVSTYCMGGEL